MIRAMAFGGALSPFFWKCAYIIRKSKTIHAGRYWSDCASHVSRSLPPYVIGLPNARLQVLAIDSPLSTSGPTMS